jgi:hypothetical protein
VELQNLAAVHNVAADAPAGQKDPAGHGLANGDEVFNGQK